ncbi:MAG: PepSY domain-containing protein [Paracoccus sp. (in: a-proteobacteria)]|uniref:PepSY domain-containing protein n=1 Tax=Paracoccus sp. TaxID=267 RepID=UPI0026E0E3E1|nr:PepSY domain-containing protein [Paracoccus sp. (in: a-proteobacteria)]MDO5612621.1 PepSY domain-containing protein [Paracoccus sp. (in: a-proteobacteria)]
MKLFLGIATVMSLMAGGALAQSAESQIRSQLRSQGFSNIEIERDDGRIKVEAKRGAQKIDLSYDARTGRLVERKSRTEISDRSGRRSQAGGNRSQGKRDWSRDDDDDDDDDKRGRRGSSWGGDDDDRGSRGRGRASRDDDDDDDRGSRGRGGSRGGDDDDDDDDD